MRVRVPLLQIPVLLCLTGVKKHVLLFVYVYGKHLVIRSGVEIVPRYLAWGHYAARGILNGRVAAVLSAGQKGGLGSCHRATLHLAKLCAQAKFTFNHERNSKGHRLASS